ncbi:SagB/ThcOx family dehydrogenase [Bailinhaonella thermotolerans]|uniref:SagB/ThcOx family dehydrogenase n=1 Tax=Bailinhaonella thermotolerans TaxID=1070861 RepID=A0A3A4BQH6_9ACTN|nr:SagB/ThcOx family dehydrogenase [Bailinhaonella thermotolerans]RJL33396.1 SagB/ThcOx family dehydrogenase [Bailinhaonella thermotolerans]
MQLRRSRTLVLYWDDGEFTAQDYLTRAAFAVDAPAVELLARFDEWTDPEKVVSAYADEDYDPDSVREAISVLVENGLLREEGADPADETLTRAWADWGTAAQFLHFASRDAEFAVEPAERERVAAEVTRDPAPAPFSSRPGAPRLYLPRAHPPLDAGFSEVLLGRRTHREFAPGPVDLPTLSAVLHYTFAPMHFIDAGRYGTLMLKTSPAGGARHELEAYVAVLDVEDVAPGVYHYRAENHSLELVAEGFDAETAERLTYRQGFGRAAFLCLLTAVFARSMYKYRDPRTYRIMTLNAGHLGQTFVLTCTALGLGPFQTAAFADTEVDALLGVDGVAEGCVYVLGAGRPAEPAGRSGALPRGLDRAGLAPPPEGT